MTRYTFNTRKKLDLLPNGKTRVYFDEQIVEETITTVDPETEEERTETVTMYTYRAADIAAGEPVNKGTITNAIIRADFSQADVEAIFRHKLAGSSGADEEFDEFNTAAEAAKARAVEILS